MAPISKIENDLTVTAPDGTNIAYAVAGQGPALVLTNGLTTSSFFWQYLRPAWLERHTVVTWDLPGHGRSAPAASASSASIEGQPALLACVMQAAGIPRATQVGFSVGCQIVLETYRQYPALCDGLVLLFGPAEHALRNTALPVPGSWISGLLAQRFGASFAAFVQGAAQAAALPAVASLVRASGLVGPLSNADLRQLVSDLGALHSATGTRMALSAEAHSAFDVLETLQVPLLIVAGARDVFAPPRRIGQRMHEASPGSEFVRLPNATHTALLDDHAAIARVIEDFIARRIG